MTRDGFDNIVPEARAYLTRLHDNNSRDWFQAHKAEYEAAIKGPGTALGTVIGAALSEMTGVEHTAKLFRPNRDVRFSKDKTPYNVHMHILWSAGPGPGWFFGVSPDYVTAGCGVMGFDKDQLAAWRAHVERDGASVAAMCDGLVAQGYRLGDPELKRVPPPYPQDHPHGALMRRKGLVLWLDVSGEGSPLPRIIGAFTDLKPIHDLIRTLKPA